jgi:hypothetical protein
MVMNPVRFMGRSAAGIATHLRLRHVLSLAYGRLTAPRSDDVGRQDQYQGHQL